jgi:hypothetical protein
VTKKIQKTNQRKSAHSLTAYIKVGLCTGAWLSGSNVVCAGDILSNHHTIVVLRREKREEEREERREERRREGEVIIEVFCDNSSFLFHYLSLPSYYFSLSSSHTLKNSWRSEEE